MPRFISEDTLAREYSGKDTYKWKRVEPIAGENDSLHMVDKRPIEKQAVGVDRQCKEPTRKWVSDDGKTEGRETLAKELQATT